MHLKLHCTLQRGDQSYMVHLSLTRNPGQAGFFAFQNYSSERRNSFVSSQFIRVEKGYPPFSICGESPV
jgi:hypothetical protein